VLALKLSCLSDATRPAIGVSGSKSTYLNREEFGVVLWIDREGSRQHIGTLLLDPSKPGWRAI
jgi:hypothetical protein